MQERGLATEPAESEANIIHHTYLFGPAGLDSQKVLVHADQGGQQVGMASRRPKEAS